MKKKYFFSYLAPLIGIIFLLSGFLKATDSAAFADLLGRYGIVWFGYFSPVIILSEIILGVALVLRVYLRYATLLTIAFIVCVSGVYLYGLLHLHITNCGCFGPINLFDSYPWITFLRNAILLALLVLSLIYPTPSNHLTKTSLLFIAVVFSTAAYLCGFSLHGSQILKPTPSTKTFEPQPIAESVLKDLLPPTSIVLSPDSSYLVFVFSYTCPHCKNSIGNVEQYEKMHFVDRTIGIAMADSTQETLFMQQFQPSFAICNLPKQVLTRSVSEFPTSFIIRHDTLQQVYVGNVISPSLLKK